MQTALLATKLYIPPSRPSWVKRARLLQRMTASLNNGCKLTLISAPAGFGKTTLVTEWIASLQAAPATAQAAWLSLDAGDNHLAGFLHYLVAALQTCQPDTGKVTRQMLEQGSLPPVDTLLLPLVNELARLPGPLVLVIDDYHVIQQPDIHEALTFLIEHQPPQMQVVITTRQDPLLPLARWRARGLLTDIRLKELRFSEQEAADFLNQALGFQLLDKDIAALENHTEGWIAGLQLAAVSLLQSGAETGEGAVEDFVQSFTGSDRFVMDYLMDEVLSRQPEPIQQFLLRTSVLERFNAELCEAVLGDQNGEDFRAPDAVLEYLDRINLFLIPLDNRREWYRYHHLFAELLQHRLKVSAGKGQVIELKRRASGWFEANGFPEEAIRCAQSAADWQLTIRLLLQYIPILLQRGEHASVMRWLGSVPDAAIRENPELCSFLGYSLSVTGKLDLGLEYLQYAEQNLGAEADKLGITLAFASHNACFRGDFKREIEFAGRAMELIPAQNAWARGVAAISLGLGLCHIGDPQGCEQAMHEALALGQQSNTARNCIHALTYLGRMSVLRLDFNQAERYFRQTGQYQTNGRLYPSSDVSILDLAQLKYEQNDLDQALALVEQGLDVNRFSGGIEMTTYGYRQAARLYQIAGQKEQAQAYLDKALRAARDYNLSPLTLSLNAACRVQLALADGNLREAEQAAPYIMNSLGLFAFNFHPELAQVWLLLVQGRKTEALKQLAPAIRKAEQPGWEYPRLQVRVLQALGAADAGEARQHLREALALAELGGAVRAFVDLGAPMQALLADLRPQLKAEHSAHADVVLNAFRKEHAAGKPSDTRAAGAPALAEPLTDREIEVLRLLAEGLSNAEIAQRLYLSPNTLKAHTQNIYSKLDVHSRVQVTNKARELGIIS